jgi:hypothetical protein
MKRERGSEMTKGYYTTITEANVLDFPIGTRVEFYYGMCGCGIDKDGKTIPQREEAEVIGYDIDEWGARLKVKIKERDATQTINGFTTIGVGAYLLEKAEAPKPNPNSPWAQ